MPCYQCGSEEGNSFQLCPSCIQKRQSLRQQARHSALNPERQADLVYDLSQDMWFRFSLIVHTLTICFIFFLFAGPLAGEGLVASFLFAGMVSAGIIAFFIGIQFWINMLMGENMALGLAAILVPPIIYQYAFNNWQEKGVRVYFFTHLACVAATVLFGNLLALNLGISFWEVVWIYNLYTSPEYRVLMHQMGG